MKKILLFIFVVFISIQTQAQNSNLWYKIQEIRQQHFPETINYATHSVTKYDATQSYGHFINAFNTPMIVIDDNMVSYSGVANSEQVALNKINSYNLSQIAGITYYTKNDPILSVYGASGANGVILIYTHEYLVANPLTRNAFKISFETGQIGNKQKKGK
ncbi:MAG: hypothetical protein SFU27_02810 [Thermonemataceae bacterium]|nr:hypothetical protein [Thermonemataceae bacterium]